ncbi:hypothetical protein ABFP25_11305 [Acinetobacter indicus]|jgi:hypothetical protein|uniref:hypothetical protein n=1 Tax=Acinetobacter TaxID=469 RepID=UPI0005F868AB|nr:hypothetical protein [Acinetobacter indicus]AVH13601.1 hypothetical protein CTZ23_04430 [Acinetobacter indicus]KJV44039.1 hypothetical protein VH96_09345 [Acinetobacter indicus]MDM1289906.1 hypothetical protein [Acinetobacter indicus]MDM1300923.1 hypothetical protein [Acinetobacter indicus]MDM1319939.1 hypothetical protein [Acinetobacter indicus]
MKPLFALACCTLLSACMFGNSQELKRAEQLLAQFECHNIETTLMTHSAINSYHEHALVAARQKASRYVEQYREGEQQSSLAVDEIVQQQYQLYTAACQSLGGIFPKAEQP